MITLCFGYCQNAMRFFQKPHLEAVECVTFDVPSGRAPRSWWQPPPGPRPPRTGRPPTGPSTSSPAQRTVCHSLCPGHIIQLLEDGCVTAWAPGKNKDNTLTIKKNSKKTIFWSRYRPRKKASFKILLFFLFKFPPLVMIQLLEDPPKHWSNRSFCNFIISITLGLP